MKLLIIFALVAMVLVVASVSADEGVMVTDNDVLLSNISLNQEIKLGDVNFQIFTSHGGKVMENTVKGFMLEKKYSISNLTVALFFLNCWRVQECIIMSLSIFMTPT